MRIIFDDVDRDFGIQNILITWYLIKWEISSGQYLSHMSGYQSQYIVNTIKIVQKIFAAIVQIKNK